MTRKYLYNCPCCYAVHWLEDAGETLGFICPECYWECDPGDSEYGPNPVSLEQANKNWLLYGACDPHGYWCRFHRELPWGVDERNPDAMFMWRLLAYCTECHQFTGPRFCACEEGER
jgi:hypothetical protein